MTFIMHIRIPLKRALTKMWVGFVQKRPKNSYKNVVSEPKVYEIGTLESTIRVLRGNFFGLVFYLCVYGEFRRL